MPAGRDQRCVSLPIVDDEGRTTIKRSRMGPWRAGVLALVHVVFIIHLAQWLITGMTLSPVEPSESMETLEHGVVNAGFIFFVLAILSTLIFGRFFCGWACHVVALQDLCAYLMRRARIKPKPFRSRLLIFAPLVFGLYMFVWPTFKRFALAPALDALSIDFPIWLAAAPDPHGLTAGYIVEDFWATFPVWYIAVPFLLVCGFGAVYLLGAKGFCTYGCPYGGIFAPADTVAPVRIRVTDACEHCGHCTAVCTSNVRVHEEVRDFGMVVDPGCMKCMDCVSVCPNDALYVGLGRPALRAPVKPDAAETHKQARAARARRFDLTWPEEVAFAAIFLLFFLCFRGMLDAIPMLMAIGVAAVATYLVHAAWRTIRSPNTRIHRHQLKLKGRIKPAGAVIILLALFTITAAAWSGQARWHRWRAGLAYKSIAVPVDVVLRPDFEPTADQRRSAQAGVRNARLADAPSNGGRGWRLDPDAQLRLAYMHLIDSDLDGAEDALTRVIEDGRPLTPVILQLADVMTRNGAETDAVQTMLENALELHPDLTPLRARLAAAYALSGDQPRAEQLHAQALQRNPVDPETLLAAARFYIGIDDAAQARRLIDRADDASSDPATSIEIARALAGLGDIDAARARCTAIINEDPTNDILIRAASLLSALGAGADARSALAQLHDPRPGVSAQAADIHAALGDVEGARRLLIDAGAALDDPWEQAAIARRLLGLASAAADAASLTAALDLYTAAVDAEPQSATLRHDQAAALFAAGRDDDAVAALTRAAELAPTRALFARRLAGMLRQLGRDAEAARWENEADGRPIQ